MSFLHPQLPLHQPHVYLSPRPLLFLLYLLNSTQHHLHEYFIFTPGYRLLLQERTDSIPACRVAPEDRLGDPCVPADQRLTIVPSFRAARASTATGG